MKRGIGKKELTILEETTYYLLLIVIAAFSLGLSFTFSALVIFFDSFWIYLALIILCIVAGTLVHHFLKSIDSLSDHHYAAYWIILALSALAGFFFVYSKIESVSLIQAVYWAILYIAGFVVPSIIQFTKRK